MNDIRKILNIITERDAYTIQSNGTMVNVNVDRNQPSIQIQRQSTGEVFDLHGEDQEELRQYIADKNGWDVFEPGAGEPSSGGNERLDGIVAQYAKPGMTLDDLSAMEEEAGNDRDSAYVLAHAARTLGLDGLYRSNGEGFCYLEDGEVKTAGGANRQQMQDIADLGLLPPSKVEQAEEVADRYRESDPEKAERFQQVADTQQGEDPQAQQEPTTNQSLEDARAKYTRFMELLTKAMEDADTGGPGDTGPNESWRPKSYADQLLEALAADELEELEQLYSELSAIADGEPFGDDLDDQIADAINRYDMWKAGNDDQADQDDAQDNQDYAQDNQDDAEENVDYSSDETIDRALDDVAAWIENELPKELEAADARGLMKATNRGQKKSASAAAIQKVLTQIGSLNNNDELAGLDVDGYYGPGTINAVKRAQTLAEITVDGDVGADTAKELLDYSKNPQSAIDDAMRTDFARIEELIAKHNEGGETSRLAQQNASVDFSMRSILETLSRINEALTADEYTELRGLLDKHRAKITNPETRDAYEQYADIFDTADEIPNPEETPAPEINNIEDVEWTGDPVEFANIIYQAGENKFFGTDESKIFDILGRIPNKQAYDSIEAEYKKLSEFDTILAALDDEMNKRDERRYVFPHMRRLGIPHNIGTGPGGINGRTPQQKQASVDRLNQEGDWSSLGSYNADGAWQAGESADSGQQQQQGGGESGYEYVGSSSRNGTAPQAEQDADAEFIIAYWDGTKYFIDPQPRTNGEYYGGTRRNGPKGIPVVELKPAVEIEAARRAQSTTPDADTTDDNTVANPDETPTATGVVNPNQQQNASKDYGMRKAINEAASMNISMSGDNAGEVGELLKILKNAGMPDAAPVGAVDTPMDMEMPAEPQGPMPCATCGGDHDEDTPCGGGEGWDNSPDEDHGELSDIIKLSGGPNSNKNPGDIRVKDPSPYEDVEEDGWDNSPDEEYKDDDYMYQSGGIHKKKKSHPPVAGGDNPMALENSIKAQLYKALEEKLSEVK